MLESVVDLLARTNAMATGRSEPTDLEIEPLYAALDAVHSDYAGFFDMIHRAIVAGEPVSDIAQTLILRSPEAECERTAVLAHMRLLAADALGSEAYPFLNAVTHYFHVLPLSGQGGMAGTLRRATEQARDAHDDALHARAEIAYSIHASQRILQRQWGVVRDEYEMFASAPVRSELRAQAVAAARTRPFFPMGAIGARLKAQLAEALP